MNFLRRLLALGLVWGGLIQLPGTATAASYTLTDLGPGSAAAINSSGIIALNEGDKAFRVTDGNRQELKIVVAVLQFETQFIAYATSVKAADINDSGHIVGSTPGHIGSGGSFIDFGETNRFAGDLDAPILFNALNNAAVIAGAFTFDYATPTVWLNGPAVPSGFAVLYAPLPGGPLTGYRAAGAFSNIREDGVTVGTLASADLIPRPIGGWFPAYHRGRAARMEATGEVTFLDLRAANDYPGSNFPPLSEALAINASGEVVGQMAVVADGPVHAFRHVGAGLEDLGTLGGTTSGALDINAGGVIVGYSTIANGDSRAFL